MPTYDYECICGNSFEAVKKVVARAKTRCPKCGQDAKQVMSKPMISKLYPFQSEDFEYGKTITVKSKKHHMELCKQYGVYAIKEFGKGFNLSEI